jgi:hypothetical protein
MGLSSCTYQHWIVVGAIVSVGLAILTDAKAMRQKDPSGP